MDVKIVNQATVKIIEFSTNTFANRNQKGFEDAMKLTIVQARNLFDVLVIMGH